MKKIKNIHYLYMFPKIEDAFKMAIECSENGDVSGGFIKIRQTIEGLEKELLKLDSWYQERVDSRNRPNSDECIKYLADKNVLSIKQADLFNSIRWLSNKHVHMENDDSKYKNDLESLKNFCVRLDNELPSIMAHLGIGGASRKKFFYRKSTSETIREFKKKTPPINKENNYKETKQNVDSKDKIDPRCRPGYVFDRLPVLIVRFAFVLFVLGFLLNILFINKIETETINKYIDVAEGKADDFFYEYTDTFEDNLIRIGTNIIDFLKFE